MQLDHLKIIEVLGGPAAVAKRLCIKVPSVYGWVSSEAGIPDARLIELGADIEAAGLYTRKQIRPNDWQLIWPELANQTEVVAGERIVTAGTALGYCDIHSNAKAA